MDTANIHEAKTHLSRLLERVGQGGGIIIAKAGKPVAKLVPYRENAAPRKPGYWRGQVRMAEDFDALPQDIIAAFEGEAP
jgi:prevent-host-death family protein